jgi:hypothetical protein
VCSNIGSRSATSDRPRVDAPHSLVVCEALTRLLRERQQRLSPR